MSKGFKIVVLLLLLLAVASTSSFAQARDPLPAYLLSIFLGFGTGHFYLHDGAAMKFLLLDIGTLAVGITGSIIAVASAASWATSLGTKPPTGVYVGYIVMSVGYLAYLGVRIWEVVDVFAIAKNPRSKVSMIPALTVAPEGKLSYGLTFQYSF